MGKKPDSSRVEEKGNIFPISFTLNVVENLESVSMLDKAIIAENSNVIDAKKAESEILDTGSEIKGVFSLSPTKILIVFVSKHDAVNAIAAGSVFWNMFDDIRSWAEGEFFDDRVVCLECFGIHPLCWSEDNVRRIGEKWGPVLSIDNYVDGLHSLTYARILVRTKAQNKIDARIRLIFEHGSCDVWVKESPCMSDLWARYLGRLINKMPGLKSDEMNPPAQMETVSEYDLHRTPTHKPGYTPPLILLFLMWERITSIVISLL